MDAVIHTRSGNNVLTVPVSAVLRDDKNVPLVYVQVEPGKFAQRLVTIGAQQMAWSQSPAGSRRATKSSRKAVYFFSSRTAFNNRTA